jgi:phospholipid-transporting ATPase
MQSQDSSLIFSFLLTIRHLKRLLAVHGRYSLVRNAYYIQYSFYKNMILTFVQVFFNFFCAFTSGTVLDSWYITFFNMVFTLLPPIYVGAFEKDFPEDAVENCPELYQQIKLGYKMTWFTFIEWFISAVVNSSCKTFPIHQKVIFFFVVGIGSNGPILENANDDIWVYSMYIGICCHLVITIKALLEMTQHTLLSVVCYSTIWSTYLLWHAFYSLFPVFFLDGHNNYYNMFCKLILF